MAITDATRLADFATGVGTGGVLSVDNINATGVVTATSFSGDIVGAAVTTDSQGIRAAGIVTATSFDGPVSSATGDFSIADKIIHTGDTNTALRFPAADTFTVETGGSERIRITSAGKVGIGTASPEDLLHISDGASGTSETANAQLVLESGASTNYLVFQNPNTQNAGIKWSDAGGQSNALINYDHNTDDLWIGADDDIKLATAGSERLRITDAGRIYIGDHPSNIDTSENNSYAWLRVQGNTYGATSDGRIALATGYQAYQLGAGDGIGSIWFADETGGDWAAIRCKADGQGGGSGGAPNDANDYPGRLEFLTTPDGSGDPVERMRITNKGGILLSNGILVEHCKIVSTAWSTTNDISLDDGNVFLNTANLAGTNNTIDIGMSGGLNSTLADGDMTSVTLITAVNATTAYINHITIGAASVTESWVGGSAPTAGGGSGYDVYTFNIIKTAANTYVVIANQVKGS